MVYHFRYKLKEFSTYMSGLKGYVNEVIKDDEYKDSVDFVKTILNDLLKYAYVHNDDIDKLDIDPDSCIVNFSLTDEQLSCFYKLIDWAEYDKSSFDYISFFKNKNNEYLKQKQNYINNLKLNYKNYLQSNESNSLGKKSKADFALKYGYSKNFVYECLKE